MTTPSAATTLYVGGRVRVCDLIVVDRDPLECALEALPGTQVLRTVLGGRAVWDAGALGRSHEDT
jgi:predicted amidohydrolase YtcJ